MRQSTNLARYEGNQGTPNSENDSDMNPKLWGKVPKTPMPLARRQPARPRSNILSSTRGRPMYCLDNMTRPNLSNVQISSVGDSLFAILKAANGAMLDSIGRGMLTIGTVTVVAYIFKDTDLVHNLLGIAPLLIADARQALTRHTSTCTI